MKFFLFLGGRLGRGALVVLAIVVLNFFLIRAAPGDPAAVMAGEAGAGDEKFVQQLRTQFGLDRPLPVQLGLYLKGIAQLDLGFSYRENLPVAQLIADRVPATLLLMGTAFVLSLVAGVLLGVWAASRRGKLADTLISTAALFFYATPLFWVSLMFILLFSIRLDWLPAMGMEEIGGSLTGWARIGDVASHLVLPAVTLALFFMAVYVRITRASMLEVMSLDFVKTARAKGLSAGQVLRRHVLRNALLPVITFAGIQAGQLVGGAVLIETVFSWPGIGSLLFSALLQRDYQLLLGIFLITSAMVVLVNILTDLVYRLVDPRIELA